MKYLLLASIVIFNALPVLGVIYYDITLFDLIFLYWSENILVGGFTLIRLYLQNGKGTPKFISSFLMAFFLVHYGIFLMLHGGFILEVFANGVVEKPGLLSGFSYLLTALESPAFRWTFVGLLVLQIHLLVSELENPLRSGTANPMTEPYRRLVCLHTCVLVVGFTVLGTGETTMGLLALVLIKLCFDLYFWQKPEARPTSDPYQRPQPRQVDQAEIQGKLEATFAEPTLEVNGKTIQFDNFEDMGNSKYYRGLIAMLRLLGNKEAIESMNTKLNQKILEEQKK